MLAGFAPKDEADLGGSGNAFGQQLTVNRYWSRTFTTFSLRVFPD